MRGVSFCGGGKCHIVGFESHYEGNVEDDCRLMFTLCERQVVARDYFETWVLSEVGATCKQCLGIFNAGAKHEAGRPSRSLT